MSLPRSSALFAVTTLLLAGCGSGTGSANAGSSTPVSGGSLTFAVDTEPVSFDIHVASQDIAGAIQRNVFDSLVAEDAAGAFHAWLASSWEVATDLKSYTFHLRKDVKFSDGTDFNADAVKLNFDRIAAPATKSQLAASLLGPYAGTDVIDPYTVKVRFTLPFAPFLQAASTAYLGFYSPKTLAVNGTRLGAGGPVDVGTGPFIETAYTKGQSLLLKRNPAYHWGPGTSPRTGPAYLDTLTIRFLPEASVRVGSLSSGQVDVAAAIPPANVKTVQANGGLQVVHKDYPGGNYNIYLNGSKAPLDDENVRKAIQRGINVGVDVQAVYFGEVKRAWSPLSPVTPGYSAALENGLPYDPAQAGRLLDQAGWTARDADGYRTKGGQRLTLGWPLLPAGLIRDQRNILGQAIQADLKKIGVEVTRPQPDIGTYITQVYGGKADLVDYSWGRFEPDVLWLLFNGASAPAKGGQNATFVNDPLLTQWTDQARATLDRTTRADLYAKTQQRAVDLGLVVPVYVPGTNVGVSQRVKGLRFDANAWPLFQDTWLGKK